MAVREPDTPAEEAAMSMEDDAMDDDYYAAAEAEADEAERELEAQNEAEDARHFILGSSADAAIKVDGAGAGDGDGDGDGHAHRIHEPDGHGRGECIWYPHQEEGTILQSLARL